MNITQLRRRKSLIIAFLPLAAIPLAYLVAYIYFRYVKIYIMPCPVRGFFHICCAGCGATRCVYALLRGDFLSAVRCNAVVVGLIFLLVLYYIENILALFGKRVKIIPRSNAFFYIATGIAAVYFILRNFLPILAPINL